MARTTTYYENRINKARDTALRMGFDAHPSNVLCLVNEGTTSDPRWRETWRLDEIACTLLVRGECIRASVSNLSRTVAVYVDPSLG